MDRDVVGGSRSHHEEIGVVLKAMKLVMGLVFVGWLMLWIMVPTRIYKYNWLPKLRAYTSSTYFGIQGTNMLIFTFPILLISVLGCIHLHLQVKGSIRIPRGSSFTRRLAVWKKPVVVRWPLGIVSGIELSFCFMFLALLIWYFSMYLSVGFSGLHGVPNKGEKLWQSKLGTAAVRLALVGNLCCAFLFFPVTRLSSLLPLVGLNSESCIKYHVWLGHTAMILFTSHGTCFVVYWATTNQIDEMLKWEKVGIANLAGEIALVTGLVMWATTFPRIRRKMFELFLYAHQLYILLLFFYLFHVGINNFFTILPGIYLFMVDRFLRFLQSRNKVRLISARLLPSETLELNFSKSPGFSYNPISSVFINVPTISSLQWHPFTVTSNSNLEPDKLSIIIKTEGSWTQKLYQKLSSPCPNDRLDISIEGPYGPTSMDFLRYDSLIMVSGGSGITPFVSIFRELIHRSTNLDSPTPSVLLICAFKTSADLTMLDLLLPASGDVSDLSRLQLRVEAFITREKAPADGAGKIIRTVWFEPIASDVPISPVLGPNSWFWLGAIVSSSFVAFLVLIGILTRYYIYPIDHNSNAIYSSSARALLNLLFICFSIVAAASAAVLWNKRGSAMEAKQVQNMDAPSPATTPSSWFYDAERELESVPLESVVKATNVHYGARPEFKKMLLEYDGSNVGVLASGPTKMRHEVADVCSSSLAENLHFESISFSW